VLGSGLTDTVVAGVRAVSAENGGFTVIEAPAPAAETVFTAGNSCSATVTVSSANLRSGPGTGYSVLDYAYRGENYPVGGRNPENNWVVIGTSDGGSAWLSLSVAQMQDACAELTVFNVPLRNAAPAQIVINAPSSSSSIASAGSGGGGGYSDEDDHHEHEGDHDEHDDD
jgi:uncharacterized protein YraI